MATVEDVINYRDVTISVHGNTIDPSGLITHRQTVSLSPIADNGKEHPADLEIIE
jgi:hypothetical protein